MSGDGAIGRPEPLTCDPSRGRWSPLVVRLSSWRILAAVLALTLPMLFPATTRAQQAPTPQQICRLAAQASQQGGPGLYTVFGQQLLQLIFQQTGGTGVYAPLVQLGQIVNIVIGGVNQLPNGTFVSCRVVHANGFSDWQIGFSPFTQRIENSTFTPYWTAQPVAPQPFTPQPAAPNAAVPQPFQQPTGKASPQPAAPTQSEACKKFPNLC